MPVDWAKVFEAVKLWRQPNSAMSKAQGFAWRSPVVYRQPAGIEIRLGNSGTKPQLREGENLDNIIAQETWDTYF
jgi:hypothetical protein